MKVGVNLDDKNIYIEVTGGGLTTSSVMSSVSARFIAEQLIKSAEALDAHNEGAHGKEDE